MNGSESLNSILTKPSAQSIFATPSDTLTVAYFSMEFGFDPAIPTYSGGLGILAGDTIRAIADLGIPAAGITLLHRKGYFRQHLDKYGNQSESDSDWHPEQLLELLPAGVLVTLGGRQVQVQAWRYLVRSEFGHTVPVYFLDTAIPENTLGEQSLSGYLYGGDERYRLCQQAILGLGGVTLVTLVVLVLFAAVWLPRNRAQRAGQETQVSSQNTAVAAAIQQTSAARSWTSTPTVTPIPNTPTPKPSPTLVVAVASTASTSTSAAALSVSGVQQDAARTATVAALLTAAAKTPAPTTAYGAATAISTALPGTGFIDDIGGPGLLIAAVLLVVVIFLARRLRMAGTT